MITEPRPKFEFLDGIRGLSALIVVLYHAQLFTGTGFKTSELSFFLRPLSFILSFGHFSVAVFIVLSGFCLAIPVATEKKLRGGFAGYLRRRALRILPPYYFALLIFIIFIGMVPIMQSPAGTAWDSKIPVTPGAVISHLLMIHNLHRDWRLKIDGPMWSVGTEWQIYFFFPVLLYIWRKAGLLISLLFAFAIGFLPFLLLPARMNFSWVHPWYLGLFALGMASAILAFSKDAFFVKIRSSVKWNIIVYPLTLLMFVGMVLTKYYRSIPLLLSETMVGFVVCVIIINFTLKEVKGGPRSWILKMLNSKFVVKLGVFSYSVYLIHSPLLGFFNLLAMNIRMSLDTRFLYMLFIVAPACIAISYIFHYYIERRFMTVKVKPAVS